MLFTMTNSDPPISLPGDARRFAPATQRNRDAILQVLQKVLPFGGQVLEIASGSGEHAAYFAPRLSPQVWQPSDPNPEMRASIAAHAARIKPDPDAPAPPEGSCVKPPIDLDVTRGGWPLELPAGQILAVVSINMIHIAPWAAAEGLVAGAGSLLRAGGVLFLYGPFKRSGQHTAASNAAFDESLKAEDSGWGLRDVEAVEALAAAAGFGPAEVIEMPANNLSLIFRHT